MRIEQPEASSIVQTSPSKMAVRVEYAFAHSLRPLADGIRVHGAHLYATRAGFAAFGLGRIPPRTRTWRVSYDGLAGRWFAAPASSARTGIVLYLHGGGFAWGSPTSYRALSAWLSHHARMPLFVPHYRRAPEHAYPAAVHDALAAYRVLLDRGVASSRITVAGDSAGGYLVASLLGEVRRAGLPGPAAAAFFSPFLDLTCEGMRERDRAGRDPFASPAYALRAATAYAGGLSLDDARLDVLGADKSAWPPALIQVGGTECMLTDAERLAKSLADAGVPCDLQVWPGQVHVFQALSGFLPEGRKALRYAGDFLRRSVAPA